MIFPSTKYLVRRDSLRVVENKAVLWRAPFGPARLSPPTDDFYTERDGWSYSVRNIISSFSCFYTF